MFILAAHRTTGDGGVQMNSGKLLENNYNETEKWDGLYEY
jgi:hypothetical protein